jgi:hypothetical protein
MILNKTSGKKEESKQQTLGAKKPSMKQPLLHDPFLQHKIKNQLRHIIVSVLVGMYTVTGGH